MLPTSVLIFSPASLGSGKYTAQVYFQTSTKAKFVNLGDVLQDSNSNQYSIITPTSIPSTNGATLTLQFLINDTIPQSDVDFNSSVFTPGQKDLRPKFRISGTLSNIILFNAPEYEWELKSSWINSSQANKAAIGDSIVDSTGREFTISFLNSVSRFSVPIRVKEKEKLGESPVAGSATLYGPTSNLQFFHGTDLATTAHNNIRHRDFSIIDFKLKDVLDSEDSVKFFLKNTSGLSIPALTPVSFEAGSLKIINPSIQSDITKISGITESSISNNSSGNVIFLGRMKNISSSIPNDSEVFLSKSGGTTASIPDIGSEGFVSGDFVVSLGYISENSINPSKKDFVVNIHIRGQL